MTTSVMTANAMVGQVTIKNSSLRKKLKKAFDTMNQYLPNVDNLSPEEKKIYDKSRTFYLAYRDIPNEVITITDVEEFYKELKKYDIYSFSHCQRDVTGIGTFMISQTFNQINIKRWTDPNPDWIEFTDRDSNSGKITVTGTIIKVEKEIKAFTEYETNQFTVYFADSDTPLVFEASKC